MSPRLFLPFVSAALLLSGCDEFRYEITMRRTADGAVLREVRYSVHDQNRAAPKKSALPEHLSLIYGGAEQEAAYHALAKTFRAALPTDQKIGTLANFGVTGTSISPLGTVHTYRERAPGPTRPWNMVLAMERTIDTAIRAWLAYAASTPELRSEPDKLHALESLLRGPVHDDVMDLLLIVWQSWLAQARDERQGRASVDEHALAAQVSIFLHERGYLDNQAASMTDPMAAMGGFRGLLKRIHVELGGAAEDPLPPGLAKLLDTSEMTEAFEAGLCAIGMTEDDFSRTLQEGFAFSLFGNTLTATIRWVDGPQPVRTNGAWSAETGELSWKTRAVDAPLLPDVLYAVWAAPNEDAQRARFGVTVLRENLPQYNDWYQALPPAARAEWDEFVTGFTPDVDAIRRLRSFTAARETPGSGSSLSPEARLSTGAVILLDELSKSKSE